MQYLLGLVVPEEAASLEERLVTDKEFYNELMIAEDELIDQYLSGGLSGSEQEQFENHFLLMPERQKKVRFGRALTKYANAVDPMPDEDAAREKVSEGPRPVPKPPPKPWYTIFLPRQNPILSYSLATVLVLVVAAAGWFALKSFRGPATQPFAITLAPSFATRGGGGAETKQISIPPGTGTVQLRLELSPDEFASYSAKIQSAELETIYSQRDLKSEGAGERRIVKVDIPATFLTVGDFQIKLSGRQSSGSEESVATYYLKVR